MAFAPDRIARVNEILKRELADILEKQHIMPDNLLVSVVKVNCSSSLKNATVYVSIFTPGKKTDAERDDVEKFVIRELENHRALLQHLVAKNVVLKYTPVLKFTVDRNMEEGDRVLSILRDMEN